ncbi:MAG: DUF6263 family protein [Planctomycetota bacterium]
MLHKTSVTLIIAGVISVLFISGCGSSVNLSLKFSPEDTAAYKATTDVIKDYRFDQPNLDKLVEQQTKTRVVMEYSQAVQDVDENGNASIKVTINELKIDIINKNETAFSFDSRNEKDQKAPMAKLLGQSYTIKVTPSGRVTAVVAKEALAAVKSQYEKKIAKSILAPKIITKRHEIVALPKNSMANHSVKSSWSKVVPSPPGLLAPKSYEKTYTLTAIDDDIATVEMVAGESAKPVESNASTSDSMGVFAKMFDNVDDYTGSMQIDLTAGQVLKFEETLISSYVAQEIQEHGDPDTLTMRFTNSVKLEKLN